MLASAPEVSRPFAVVDVVRFPTDNIVHLLPVVKQRQLQDKIIAVLIMPRHERTAGFKSSAPVF